nr:hypothetical protein [Tanacetum cinerariifolium]
MMESQADKYIPDIEYVMGDWCKGEVSESGSLPVCDDQGVMKVKPIAILDRRLAKRGNDAAVFVLVQRENGSKEDATWEPIEQIQKNFPSLKL